MEKKLFLTLKTIPAGFVVSYSELARFLGFKSPRQVGRILHQNQRPDLFPCHRVVKKDGNIANGYAFGGAKIQKKLLLLEGVVFENNRVPKKLFVKLS